MKYIMISIFLAFIISNAKDLKKSMPGRLSSISNVIFWGGLFLYSLFKITSILPICCILGSIFIFLYQKGTRKRFSVGDKIILFLDVVYKIMYCYLLYNNHYSVIVIIMVTVFTISAIALFNESKKV